MRKREQKGIQTERESRKGDREKDRAERKTMRRRKQKEIHGERESRRETGRKREQKG